MKVDFFIARRYLFAKDGEGLQSVQIITWIASAGIMLTTAALFVILSAFSGLRSFNLSLLNKTDPDLRIYARSAKYFNCTDTLCTFIKNTGGIEFFSPVVEEKALLRLKDKQAVVLVRGVDTAYQHIIRPDSILLAGKWIEPGFPGMFLGNYLANKLAVSVNDPDEPVYLLIPSRKTNGFPGEQIISRPMVVTGIYNLTPDIEKKYVYIPIDVWRQMLFLSPEQVSFIDISVTNPEMTGQVKLFLENHLKSAGLEVKDRLELNKTVLKMLNTENLFTYLTGLLFLIISAFNIVGSIIILILKKRKDRFILSGLGMPLGEIRKIFFYYGNLLLLLAGFTGLLLGLIIVWIQKHYGIIYVPGTYLVYPVEIKWKNFLWVTLTLLAVSLISSWLASKAVKQIKEKL